MLSKFHSVISDALYGVILLVSMGIYHVALINHLLSQTRYRDSAGNTTEDNSSVFSLIQMH